MTEHEEMREMLDQISKQLLEGAAIMSKLEGRMNTAERYLHGENGEPGLITKINNHDNILKKWIGVVVGATCMWGLLLGLLGWILLQKNEELKDLTKIAIGNQTVLASHDTELKALSQRDAELLTSLVETLGISLQRDRLRDSDSPSDTARNRRIR